MNTLLERQIAKFIKPEHLKDLNLFLIAVNDSYENYEDQLSMSQRAMKISSDELFEANKKLRVESSNLKEINKNLSDILQSMNLDPDQLSYEKEFSKAEYLKKQAYEIVEINKQREQLLKNLAEQNQELNEYAHVVSHDLKAPLRNIDTLINWFIQDNDAILNDDNKKSLQVILSNVEKMDFLIKGILEYSSIDKVDTQDRLIDFNIAVNEVIRTINVPESISISIEEKLPTLFGNAMRFKQLFQNLIQNAIMYNDKSQGSIQIGVIDNDTNFQFYIKDNGIGINELYHKKIFNIFTKLESNNQSSGIGLSIVKKIIDFYEGAIWLESEENKGTTFYFTLPKKNGAA
ncbi:ATP-binding protein [Flavobacterium sp.]|uniref:sensor histidine kinase n=1 Tax=Flavobacterium sp. TaxID=239 RepID=UPI002612B8E8|nr:ATP-binding protein [Flavobacterium sp.]MDG2431650.1 ATP-binding protein [Flavobacterium sp.]